jgi:hypothetical protein
VPDTSAASETKTATRSFLTEKLPALIAITTVILAVCTTLASFKAAGYGNRMVLAQSQASDQWAYYQAKSIKETTYQVQRDSLNLLIPASGQEQARTAKLAEFDKEIGRYKAEKKEIMEDAQRLEKERDVARTLNASFGQSMIFLQIGILFSSLASINKGRYYWYMAVASGGTGVEMFLHYLIKTL